MISIMSRDRVGIIADVTSTVKKLNGNLEDISQTVLRDFFTMILFAGFSDNVTEDVLREELKSSLGGAVEIGVIRLEDGCCLRKDQDSENQDAYVVTASGPDKVGLVSAISEFMRIKKINIIDLATRSENGIYTMILLVNLPAGTDVAKLKRSLQTSMEVHDMTVEMRHQAIFRKVNDI